MNGTHETRGPTRPPSGLEAESADAESAESDAVRLPDVQVFLSRPSYPLGGTVVGTIVIQRAAQQKGSGKEGPAVRRRRRLLRSDLQSVTVYVAGYCKIDGRWHNVSDYARIYGGGHPYLQMLTKQGGGRFDVDLVAPPDDTVCVWATNGLDVLNDVTTGGQPTPSSGGTGRRRRGEWRYLSDGDDGNDGDGDGNPDVLAFTFRADIPKDLPHSVHAATCRYYYSADVLVQAGTQQQVLRRGFQVTTSPGPTNEMRGAATSAPRRAPPNGGRGSNSNNSSSNYNNHIHHDHSPTVITGRVKFGTCLGMAHPDGLPCHVSAAEVHRPRGQMAVVQERGGGRADQRDVQTLRVSNAEGRPACVLTVIGARTLTPGASVQLQWDFPAREHRRRPDEGRVAAADGSSSNSHHSHRSRWIPCHQVSACLRGEERAVFEDGSRTRTRALLFDTCHERVDPGVTDRVSHTLRLSGDHSHDWAPCGLGTDLVELNVWCQVDLAVLEGDGGGDNGNGRSSGGGKAARYSNLALRIPCRVRHHLDDPDDELEAAEGRMVPLNELLGLGGNGRRGRQNGRDNEDDEDYDDPSSFPTHDILPDLKALALSMEERVRTGVRHNY